MQSKKPIHLSEVGLWNRDSTLFENDSLCVPITYLSILIFGSIQSSIGVNSRLDFLMDYQKIYFKLDSFVVKVSGNVGIFKCDLEILTQLSDWDTDSDADAEVRQCASSRRIRRVTTCRPSMMPSSPLDLGYLNLQSICC